VSVYRWFSSLVNEMTAANQWIDAEVLFRATSSANALFEFIFDKPAPGATSQAIQGHDHTSTQGGRVVARGSLYSGGAGKNQFLQFVGPGSGVWGNADNANTSSRQRSTTFWAYSSATTSGSSSPYTNPVAWCSLRFQYETHGTARVISARLQNNTTSKTSDVVTFNIPGSTGIVSASPALLLEEVPISSGWNEYTLELMSDHDSPTVYTSHICLFEAADVDGCFESSTGVSPLGGA